MLGYIFLVDTLLRSCFILSTLFQSVSKSTLDFDFLSTGGHWDYSGGEFLT